jgi:penicillin amidase
VTAALRRAARWLGIATLLMLVACAAGGYWWLCGSLARVDGTRATPGLIAPVSIERDALGTVTISGANRDDISFALGYVHAQERYFAMDLMRRMPAGELAALVGPAALKSDLDHRRHRLRAVVRQALAQLPDNERRSIERYTQGVNAGLGDLRRKPWEYLLLRAEPQPWHAEDSLLTVAAMYLNLNGDGNNTRELRMAQMRAALPKPVVDLLLAPDAHWEAPLRGALSPLPVIPGAAVLDLRGKPPAPAGDKLAAALQPATDKAYPGSNSFAVGGALTASGAAMLANDMHLKLGVPNIWFRTRLRYADASAPGGQRDVNGLSLPGTPAIIVGSNGQIAWGFTNSYGDWLDWVRVIRDPADPSRYKVPEGWATLTHTVEPIAVKGQADTRLEVTATRWGPVLATDVDGTPLALAWTGALPRGYNLDLMRMERTTNVADALALAPRLGMPAQNLLVADRSGHIGWTLAGNSVPLRGSADPDVPADWSGPGSGWQGWLAASDYPRLDNPPDHRLWTANNRIIGGADLARLGNGGYDLGARAQQIRDDLRARGSFTPGALLDIQLDDRAVFLGRWQRLLQETLAGNQDPALQPLRELTAAWRGRAATGSVDYRLVRAFRSEVTSAVLAPFVARVQAAHADFSWPPGTSAEAAVWALLHAQPAHLLDPRYASWHALLLDAARKVTTTLGAPSGGLAARTWGEHNRSDIHHPLAAVLPPWLAHFIDMPDQPLPGDHDMPRVAAPGFGASERMAVAPGDEAHGTLSMPGGQSAHPLSPYFGAGHEDWVRGRPTPLLPGAAEHVLRLTPADR